MSQFKAIGFDWGGVIHVAPGKKLAEAAAEFLGVSVADYRRAYFSHNNLFNKNPLAQKFSEAVEMWTLVLEELGRKERLEDFLVFLRTRPPAQIDERVIRLIQFLKRKKWALGLLSNNSPFGAAEARKIDLSLLFDVVLFSAELGFMKPEPAAFQALADRLGILVSELIFIDDAERSLSSASLVGYQPILYTGFKDLLERLTGLGILSDEEMKIALSF